MIAWHKRLAFRLYLGSLAQLLIIVAAIVVIHRLAVGPRPASPHLDVAAYVVNTVMREPDPAARTRELERARSLIGAQLSAYGPRGELLLSTIEPPLPPLPPPLAARLPADGMEVGRGEGGPIFPPLMAVPLQGGGYALLLPGPRPNRPPPGLPPPVTQGVWGVVIALAVAGIASILASRAFAAPLTRLSDAARELGSGNLSVRVKLARSDELGALAEAFDEMAERLQLLLRGQQELLANVSHELRTPLARIRVALDLASEGDAAMAREALGEIAEDLGELEVLVADVLRMARLDLAEGRAGTAIPPLKAVRVEPRALLDSSVARFRSAHPERALTLEVPAALPECSGDPVLLRRVVDNLLDNARKYSEADIVLRASHTDDQLHLVVEDRGIGIAPEDLPLVAQPFFRADKSRARKTGGLGLGLSLARRIVEAHGGSLRIESAVGVGTSVHVQLPCGRPLSPPSVA